MIADFAKHERAIGEAQRAHSEAVEHAAIREAPVAPRQEACEIGLEITGAEAIGDKNRIARQQNASIPDLRFLDPLEREMGVDIGAPLVCEWPRPGLETEIKRRDAMNHRKRHAALFRIYPRRLLGLIDILVGAGLAAL